MSSILSIADLHVWYGSVHAVRGINASLGAHRITALIGASGSGKSSVLRCINRMVDSVPRAKAHGSIHFHDEDILDEDTDVVKLRRRIGMVFQNPTPFPKSIFDNVAYGLEIQGMENFRRRGIFALGGRTISRQSVEESDDPLDQAVVRSLKEAALWEEVKDRLHHSAYRLSGGQQQRLCIARAIAVRPEVLLLDEPCSELDPISTRHIEELLLALKTHYTIVIVTHNMHQARRIADDVGFFHAGELVEFGPVGQIFGNAQEALTRQYVEGAFG